MTKQRYLCAELLVLLAAALSPLPPSPAAAGSPRAIQPRGELCAVGRARIAMFDRIASSVVQVAARSESAGMLPEQKIRVASSPPSWRTRPDTS
jgi:hypothetical protein